MSRLLFLSTSLALIVATTGVSALRPAGAPLATTNFTTSGRAIMLSSSTAGGGDQSLPTQPSVFQMRGFSYGNYRIGEGPTATTDGPDGFDAMSRVQICKQDFPLMRQYNVNGIKIYDFNVIANGIDAQHTACLDEAWNNGVKPIFVILSVWFSTLPFPTPQDKQNTTSRYSKMVMMTRDHPAVMGYSIGSEFGGDPNDNAPLWTDFNAVASAIHTALEGRKKIVTTGVYQAPCNPPVCTPAVPDIGHIINGEAAGAQVDVWGVDIYSPNPQMPSLRQSIWQATTKPFFFPEFGVWYQPPLNVTVQTQLLKLQVEGMMQYSYNASTLSKNQGNASGTYDASAPVYAGGLIFEWIDEYWKGGTFCHPNPGTAQPWYGANQVELREGCTCHGGYKGTCATNKRTPRPILSDPTMLPSLWNQYTPGN